MRVWEGKKRCPELIVLPPDPWKYRFVNQRLLTLLSPYTPNLAVKSIDEMALDFTGTKGHHLNMEATAHEIKRRIKQEIGDWLTVSIGIAPNRYLAKVASSLQKPDGLTTITHATVHNIFSQLQLEDLCGIKRRNRIRLNMAGVFTSLQFLDADSATLKRAFRSILAFYWHARLRGWEIDAVEFARKSYGQSYALRQATSEEKGLAPLLCKLVEKMGARMRKGGYAARGIHVACSFRDGSFWHSRHHFHAPAFASNDLYTRTLTLFAHRPRRLVTSLAVSCFDLVPQPLTQLSLLPQENKWRSLTLAIDRINERWGAFVVSPARMMGLGDKILDRISYGNIRDTETALMASFTVSVVSISSIFWVVANSAR